MEAKDENCPQCGTPFPTEPELEAVCPMCTLLLALGEEPGDRKTLGGYVLLGELGSGGMGIVYKGYKPSLNLVRAIKVLRPELAKSDPGLRGGSAARLANWRSWRIRTSLRSTTSTATAMWTTS